MSVIPELQHLAGISSTQPPPNTVNQTPNLPPVIPTAPSSIEKPPAESSVTTTSMITCIDLVGDQDSNSIKLEDYIDNLTTEEYLLTLEKCKLSNNELSDFRLRRGILLLNELSFPDRAMIISDVYRRLSPGADLPELHERNISSVGQWMRVTLGLCDLKRFSLTGDQILVVQQYLDWHLAYYPATGAQYFTSACGTTPQDYKQQLEIGKIDLPIEMIDLTLSSLWPAPDYENLSCLYFDKEPQVLSRVRSEQYESYHCSLPIQLLELQNRRLLTGVRMEFSGYNLPVSSTFGYGAAFLQDNSGIIMRIEQEPQNKSTTAVYQIKGTQLVELARSDIYIDQTKDPPIFLPGDSCGARMMLHPMVVGNLVIWRIKTQDAAQEKIQALLAGVLNSESSSEPIELGFAPWLPKESGNQELRFCFTDFAVEKSGGLR